MIIFLTDFHFLFQLFENLLEFYTKFFYLLKKIDKTLIWKLVQHPKNNKILSLKQSKNSEQ